MATAKHLTAQDIADIKAGSGRANINTTSRLITV